MQDQSNEIIECPLCGTIMTKASVMKGTYYCINKKCDEFDIAYGVPKLMRRNITAQNRINKAIAKDRERIITIFSRVINNGVPE